MNDAAAAKHETPPRRSWLPRVRFSLRTLVLTSLLWGSGVLLWQHREPWQVRMTIRENNYVLSADISRQDAYIYTVTQTTRDTTNPRYQVFFKTYSRETGRLISTISGQRGYGFSRYPGEKYIHSYSGKLSTDGSFGEVLDQLWCADTGELLRVDGIAQGKIRLNVISARENFATLYATGKFGIVKLPSLQWIVEIKDEPMGIHDFSPDEKWLAVAPVTEGKPRSVRLIPTLPAANVHVLNVVLLRNLKQRQRRNPTRATSSRIVTRL